MKQHIEVITNTMSRSARNTLVQITQNVQNNKKYSTISLSEYYGTFIHWYIGNPNLVKYYLNNI